MTTLTSKTRAVLVELLKEPGTERPARDVARAAGVPANVAGNLLGRLITMGYAVDRRTTDGTRMFRVAPKKLAEAAEAAGVALPRAEPAPSRPEKPKPASRSVAALPDGVLTVSQVRAAYARGDVSREFLDQVERAVAATVKPGG